MNLLLDTDSYKFSHFPFYPKGMSYMHSYLESRGGRFAQTTQFGLQYILKKYLTKPITAADIDEAETFAKAHGEPFNRAGFEAILNKHGGYMPVRIKAVPEGMVIPNHNVITAVESTGGEETCWIVNFLETMLMRQWYPTTVATQSWHIRKIIKGFLDETADKPEDEIWFKLHDFGARGVSSRESAAIGGAAHLVNFMGSDTIAGVQLMNDYYNKGKMSAFSIPATEHSTVTSWGRENELEAYKNVIRHMPKGGLLACVSDSYNIFDACSKLWGTDLKKEVENSGGTLVIRPDSGDPVEVVDKVLQILDDKFGYSYNTKGFKVLNHVRVIQGDGVNEESIREILRVAKMRGFSATNLAFGMGGALLQKVDRDTQKFAYKCSEVTVNGKAVPVFKDPITDHGKASKSGRLTLIKEAGTYRTVKGPTYGDVLKTVFENGEMKKEYTLAEIRENALQG